MATLGSLGLSYQKARQITQTPGLHPPPQQKQFTREREKVSFHSDPPTVFYQITESCCTIVTLKAKEQHPQTVRLQMMTHLVHRLLLTSSNTIIILPRPAPHCPKREARNKKHEHCWISALFTTAKNSHRTKTYSSFGH